MTVSRSLSVLVSAVAFVAATLSASPASAFDPEQTFKPWGVVLSLDGGGGAQTNFDNTRHQSIDLWWIQGRASLLPFGTIGKDSIFYGALEIGLEPIYQQYFGRTNAYWAGLGAATRYHFLSLGGFVPYLELGAAAGGTNLKVIEMDSHFAFRLYGGAGASLFITDHTALYAGYRMVHLSNGNTSRPNRGFEAHSGVLGVSFYFP
jgi:hypothetical protein